MVIDLLMRSLGVLVMNLETNKHKSLIVQKRILIILKNFKKAEPKESELEEFVQLLSDSVELISQFSKDSYVTSVLKFGTHKLDFSDIFERLRELQGIFGLKDDTEGFGTKENEIMAENQDWKDLESNWGLIEQKSLDVARARFNHPDILARISSSIRHRFHHLRKLHEKELTVEEFEEEEEKQEVQFFELEISAEIGRNAYSTTYQGKWKERDVAIKVFNTANLSEQTLRSWKRDLEALRKLNYPHIEKVYGYCTENSNFVLVTEYLENRSLFDVLHSSKELSWDTRKQIAEEVAKGMEFLYQVPMAHTNLKSTNILIDKDFHAKVSGFGYNQVKSEILIRSSGTFSPGNLRWCAPELFEASGTPTEKSDVYSYGMILYELATGSIPFENTSSDYLVISKILAGFSFEPNPSVPSDFVQTLKKCLLPDPKKRPSFHSVVLRDLEQDFEENGVAPPDTPGADPLKSPQVARKKKDKEKEVEQIYKQGLQYFEGKSGQRSFKKAVKYFRQSAEQGHVQSQAKLGRCYYFGEGVDKDLKEAIKWWTMAAEKGDAYSQYNLGFCLMKGIGMEASPKAAVSWYRLAAEQGYVDAQVNLGVCCYEGEGVEQNFTEAAKWWELAARTGNADAQTNIGDCYFEGEGVAKNEETAVAWYLKAAEQGECFAQLNLCNCYRFGFGVQKDLEKATQWCQMAADQGSEEALNLLSKLKDHQPDHRRAKSESGESENLKNEK